VSADRVGLGWRPELAAAIFAHLDRIDVVEVIADDHLEAPRPRLRALRMLGSQVPLTLHGVGLGLASREGLERARLTRLARLVEAVRPESWSEHLAFVRGGGREIGHLAAPPRVPATVEAVARNLAAARAAVGGAPLVENVATLIDPPGSTQAEDEWTVDALDASGAELLLDLHNLHANAVNFGFDARAFLARLPAERIAAVHLAGGRWVEAPAAAGGARVVRRLDDHLHAVPEEVFELLADVARRAPRALTVILERDGAYPPFETLLAELDRARAALRLGRAQRATESALPAEDAVRGSGGAQPPGLDDGSPTPSRGKKHACVLPPRSSGGRQVTQERASGGSALRVPSDAFLARLYTDVRARARALAAPDAALDRPGLELAAASFALKRRTAEARRARRGGRLHALLRRLRHAVA
jgi:hypothetical protein